MIWPVEQTVVGDVIGDSHAISCHELHKEEEGIVLMIFVAGYPRLAMISPPCDFMSAMRFARFLGCSLKWGQAFDTAVAVKARQKSPTSQ